jgi:DNA-binding MarR family transcriptional regulator
MNELQRIKREHSPAPAHVERVAPSGDSDLYRAQSAWFTLLRGVCAGNRGVLNELSVTEQQCAALLEIACLGGDAGLTVGGLAGRLKVRHNTAVCIVNQLCSRGLVERAPSTRDRRKVHMLLTQRGLELISRFVQANRQTLEVHRARLALFLGMPAGLAA